MKRLIFKFSFFSLICILTLAGITLATNILIDKKADFKLTKDSEYVVVGDSHPECAYNDSLISKLSNCAQSGESYFYGFFKLKGIIESNPSVKVIFIEFGSGQLEPEMDTWIWGKKYLGYKYIKYAPFLGKEDLKILSANNAKDLISNQSLVFSRNFKMLLKRKYQLMSGNDLGGYQHLVRDKTDSLLTNVEDLKRKTKLTDGYSEVNLSYLDKCITYCKSKNVTPILLRTPIHPMELELSNEKKFQSILHTRYNGVEFIDFKSFPLANNEYADLSHLNFRGSRKFSIFFNELLDKNLTHQAKMQDFVNAEMAGLSSSVNSTVSPSN